MIANWHIDIDFSTLRQPFSADSLGLVSVSDNTNYIYDVTCTAHSIMYSQTDTISHSFAIPSYQHTTFLTCITVTVLFTRDFSLICRFSPHL